MFRNGDLKFLKILILRIKSIRTSPKIKKRRKKVGIDLISGMGSSEGLKVSISGQKSFELVRERVKPINIGRINDRLLGAKLGTTDEM